VHERVQLRGVAPIHGFERCDDPIQVAVAPILEEDFEALHEPRHALLAIRPSTRSAKHCKCHALLLFVPKLAYAYQK